MAKKVFNVNGELEQYTVILIVGDGACLIRALSFLVYETQENAIEACLQVIIYVVND